jgi:hypothetical protein
MSARFWSGSPVQSAQIRSSAQDSQRWNGTADLRVTDLLMIYGPAGNKMRFFELRLVKGLYFGSFHHPRIDMYGAFTWKSTKRIMDSTPGSYSAGTGIKYRPEYLPSYLKSFGFSSVLPHQLRHSTSTTLSTTFFHSFFNNQLNIRHSSYRKNC